MGALVAYLRSLRTKPRSFHVGLVLVLAWVPLLIYMMGYPWIATIVLSMLAAAFLTIHPLTFSTPAQQAADPDRSELAANDE
jgi:hypothetical protein